MFDFSEIESILYIAYYFVKKEKISTENPFIFSEIKSFSGGDFIVNKDVYINRFDTIIDSNLSHDILNKCIINIHPFLYKKVIAYAIESVICTSKKELDKDTYFMMINVANKMFVPSTFISECERVFREKYIKVELT